MPRVDSSTGSSAESKQILPDQSVRDQVPQGDLGIGPQMYKEESDYLAWPVLLTLCPEGPDSSMSSQQAPEQEGDRGLQRMASSWSQLHPPAWHLLSLLDVGTQLQTAGSHGLTRPGLAPIPITGPPTGVSYSA